MTRVINNLQYSHLLLLSHSKTETEQSKAANHHIGKCNGNVCNFAQQMINWCLN